MNIEYCTRILKKQFKMGIMNKQFQRNSLTHRTKASDTVLFDLRLNKR